MRYHMGINFCGVLIFMDFMGILIHKKISEMYLKWLEYIDIYHENINSQNHLSFPNHEI